jgi:hypothetical protein
MKVAYTEIYNEQVNDLLLGYRGQDHIGTQQQQQQQQAARHGGAIGGGHKKELTIFEDKYAGPSVHNLTTLAVTSEVECLGVLAAGLRMRRIAATDMNDRSSRSHTIFRVCIECSVLGGECDYDDLADPYKPRRSLPGVPGRDTRLSTLVPTQSVRMHNGTSQCGLVVQFVILFAEVCALATLSLLSLLSLVSLHLLSLCSLPSLPLSP